MDICDRSEPDDDVGGRITETATARAELVADRSICGRGRDARCRSGAAEDVSRRQDVLRTVPVAMPAKRHQTGAFTDPWCRIRPAPHPRGRRRVKRVPRSRAAVPQIDSRPQQNKTRRSSAVYVKLTRHRPRRRRQGRAAVVASAVGALGARSRQERRQFQSALQRRRSAVEIPLTSVNCACVARRNRSHQTGSPRFGSFNIL